MSDHVETMKATLKKNTGHDLDWWVGFLKMQKLEKHGEMVSFLKKEHELGHGFANLIAHTLRQSYAMHAEPDDLVEAQYKGKESLRPIYDKLIKLVSAFGEDVEIAPKKASVSLRRSKQFALIEPKTKTRVDLGINLKGHEGTDRLVPAKGMCTHKVALTDAKQVDAEVKAWLKAAYQAG